jgi:hypothetical protein
MSGRNGFECQGQAVHAVAQAGGLGTVVEHVAEVTATTPTMHCGARHAKRGVGLGRDGVVERRPEAWPSGAAVVFCGGGEQVEVTAGAGKVAMSRLVQQRARERAFRLALPQDRILSRGQQPVPFQITSLWVTSNVSAAWATRKLRMVNAASPALPAKVRRLVAVMPNSPNEPRYRIMGITARDANERNAIPRQLCMVQ